MRERERERTFAPSADSLPLNELKDGKLAAFAIANAIRCLLALPAMGPAL